MRNLSTVTSLGNLLKASSVYRQTYTIGSNEINATVLLNETKSRGVDLEAAPSCVIEYTFPKKWLHSPMIFVGCTIRDYLSRTSRGLKPRVNFQQALALSSIIHTKTCPVEVCDNGYLECPNFIEFFRVKRIYDGHPHLVYFLRRDCRGSMYKLGKNNMALWEFNYSVQRLKEELFPDEDWK